MSANKPWDVYHPPYIMPMKTPDYSILKDIGLQHHFNAIHLQLQLDSEQLIIQFGLECIEHLRHAAEAYAKAAQLQWNPKS